MSVEFDNFDDCLMEEEEACSSANIEEEHEASTHETTVTTQNRSRKVKSAIWTYFEKCEDSGFARCLICGSKYQHSNNTSNLAKVKYLKALTE